MEQFMELSQNWNKKICDLMQLLRLTRLRHARRLYSSSYRCWRLVWQFSFDDCAFVGSCLGRRGLALFYPRTYTIRGSLVEQLHVPLRSTCHLVHWSVAFHYLTSPCSLETNISYLLACLVLSLTCSSSHWKFLEFLWYSLAPCLCYFCRRIVCVCV